MSRAIEAVDQASILSLCSGQVITDLSSAVKELVENSLDAQANSIQVKFKNYGLGGVEVLDNGHGISHENLAHMGKRHHTSKLAEFSHLERIQSLGFRGEAFSSLCLISDVQLTTATAKDTPKGNQLTFNNDGSVAGQTVTSFRQGTSVKFSNLFKNLPVREKNFKKEYKKEYSKILNLLTAYTLISSQVKINVSNTNAQGKTTTQLSTNGNTSIRENIVNLFGPRAVVNLLPLSFKFDLKYPSAGVQSVSLAGFISRPSWGEGRNSPDRQFYYVRSRPCHLPKVSRAINEVYRAYNPAQVPFVVMDFHLPDRTFDVNVTPDKRTIFLHEEDALIQALLMEMNELFDLGRNSFQVSQIGMTTSTQQVFSSTPGHISDIGRDRSSSNSNLQDEDSSKRFLLHTSPFRRRENLRSVFTESARVTNSSSKRNSEDVDVEVISGKRYRKPDPSIIVLEETSDVKLGPESDVSELSIDRFTPPQKFHSQPVVKDMNSKNVDFEVLLSSEELSSGEGMEIETAKEEKEQEEEEEVEVASMSDEDEFSHSSEAEIHPLIVLRSDDNTQFEASPLRVSSSYHLNSTNEVVQSQLEMQVTMEDIERDALSLNATKLRETSSTNAGIGDYVQAAEFAEERLSRTVSKQDFATMRVIGQFNLGFIIAGRQTDLSAESRGIDDDLFIIDQHASDEKFNFERLQTTTVFEPQRLARLVLLQLFASLIA